MARTSTRKWQGLAAAVLLCVSLGACGSSSSSDDTSTDEAGSGGGSHSGDAGPGKYDQTWPKNYGKTKCREWLNSMDPHQRFVAAADMLVGARSADGGNDLPKDSLIKEFTAGLDNVCPVTPQGSLAETAAGLYLTERARFRP